MKLSSIFVIVSLLNQICFAEVSISQAEAQSSKALCLDKTSTTAYSIKERKDLFHQALKKLDYIRFHGSNKEIQRKAQAKWEELQVYVDRKVLEGLDFWSVETTCPRRLDFPTTVVDSGPQGLTEAFSRASKYEGIGLCIGQVGKYSINDRIEFLNAARKIYDQIQKLNQDSMLTEKARSKSISLQKVLFEVNRKDSLNYWDILSTCPATNESRARSGPSLPASGPHPPVAPTRGNSAR